MSATPDAELKGRHRKMWASGDYPSMVETFLLPLGPRLVEAAGIGPGMKVLDVAAGTGNASIPAAEAGADVTASDLTPELFEAGRERAEAKGVELEWVEADAENLPFDDESFDVVMSSIGAMFAPHHQEVADEMVRVCKPGGTIAHAQLDARGDDRRAVQDDGPVRAAASARRAAAAAVGRGGPPQGAVRRPRRVDDARARRPRHHRVREAARLRRALQGRTTARRSSRAPTPRRTAARASSTRRSTRSATSGTSAATTTRASSRSTWWPSASAPDAVAIRGSSGFACTLCL